MKKIDALKIISLTVMLMPGKAVAQDTIYFKNTSNLSAKVLEVGIKEIKYKHYNDSTGFVFNMNKNKISCIKYANGYTDTIKTAFDPVFETDAYTVLNNNSIKILGKRLVYNGKTLNDKKLKSLIETCPVPGTRELLKKEFKDMKRYELNQKLYAPIGLTTGFMAVIITAPLLTEPNARGFQYSPQTWQIAAAGIIGGAIIRISSCVISTINKNKRRNKRNEIALIYNDITN